MSREADQLRLKVLQMGRAAGSGHMGGSLSCAEIINVLYRSVLRFDPDWPDWPERDRLVLSKGHAAPMLYACMARAGYFPEEELLTLRDLGSPLQGHPCMFKLPGVDMSTGSLGMGLSVGVGMGLSLREGPARVYVLLGDGEMQEGQNWEALMAMRAFGLTNVTPIIDLNGVQLDGPTDAVQPGQSPMVKKLEGFGLRIFEIDGHDEAQVLGAIRQAQACGEPHVIVAHTVKGKGVSFMEGQAAWHGKPLNEKDYMAARTEVEGRLVP